MGSRRTHELSAVAASRAAYLAGFATTSNLAAGRRYGIPTTGTSAHAFTLVHGDERAAFQAQVAALGAGTTLLVDTYDVAAGIRAAVEVAGPALGAIRLDSGDLREQVRFARALLDELGASATRIVVTSDLDERMIASLAAEAVDAYGVGTSVVTGSGHVDRSSANSPCSAGDGAPRRSRPSIRSTRKSPQPGNSSDRVCSDSSCGGRWRRISSRPPTRAGSGDSVSPSRTASINSCASSRSSAAISRSA